MSASESNAPTVAPAAWRRTVVRTPFGVPEIEPEDVAALRETLRVVDVREPAELTGPLGGVAYAENIPMGQLGAACRAWDRTAPLAILCRSGNRSAHAAVALERMGFTHVASVRGGMILWRELDLDTGECLDTRESS